MKLHGSYIHKLLASVLPSDTHRRREAAEEAELELEGRPNYYVDISAQPAH